MTTKFNRLAPPLWGRTIVIAIALGVFVCWLIEIIYPTGGQLRWLEVENTTNRILTIEVEKGRYRNAILPKSRVTLSEKVFRGHSFFCRFFDEDGKLYREVYLVGDELNKIDDRNKLSVKL